MDGKYSARVSVATAWGYKKVEKVWIFDEGFSRLAQAKGREMLFSPDQLPSNQDACPDGQLLIRHIARPLAVSEADAARLVGHLFACPKCAQLYDKLCDAAEHFHEEKTQVDGRPESAAPAMTHEMAVADIWRRIDAKEAQDQGEQRHRRILRIVKAAAIAACLLLAVGVYWRSRINAPQARLSQVATTRQHVPQSKVARSGDNPLGDVSSLMIPKPAPLDPATADYGKWLGENQESLVAAHPWVAPAQKALNARGIQADCLDVLMVSGGWRQFSFDPKQPVRQPLAECEPLAIRRLAEHYQVPLTALTSGGDHTAAASSSPAMSNQALRQWRSVVLATAESGSQVVLYLYTVQAGPSLAQTYSAAALWVHHHPQEAQKLLTSNVYRLACRIPPSVCDAQAWGRLLTERAASARRLVQAANELLRMPTWERCEVGNSAAWRQLTRSLDETVPAGVEEDGQ